MLAIRRLLCAGLLLSLACAAGAQDQPRVPAPDALRMLVTTTVVALSQANTTGNYTVLRDLGAPAFRQANTAAKLSLTFQKLRELNLDLSPVVLHEPRFPKPPFVDPQGFLRLAGSYPTQPLQVNFDLSFQAVEGHWRLSAISLATAQPTAGTHAPSPTGVSRPKPPVQPKAPQ